MNCDRCGCLIKQDQEMKYAGKLLCEDCYMDVLSPAKTCDPWAVYIAKSFSEKQSALTELQKDILRIAGETQGVELEALAQKLNIKTGDLEREIATLRHMEKIRAAMKDGRKVICLW
jgi:adenine-specific DNA methylase